MKKRFIVGCAALLIAGSFSIGAYAATKITLIVNGTVAKVEPKVINNTTYVPIRAAAEMLGAEVQFKGNTVTITSKKEVRPLPTPNTQVNNTQPNTSYDAIINFPSVKYPETAAHIQSAIEKGESAICTIDRDGADDNRDESLKGIPTKDGYDRDEWPMAMCAEGGAGADVAYVKSSDNRGSGSWVGNQLEAYTDGTRVLFLVKQVTNSVPEEVKPVTDAKLTPIVTPTPATTPTNNEVYYANCSAVKAAGAAPIRKGDPGYSTKLDRDGDGVACES